MPNKLVAIAVEMAPTTCCSVFMIVLPSAAIGPVKEFKPCVCEGDIANGAPIIKITWAKITYYVALCVVVSANMRAPTIEIKNPSIAGVRAPIESYKRPETADTIAFIKPPGNMMTPVKATGINSPF